MSDQQVVLTLRIPGHLLERLQTVARRLDGVRRSRSDAARYALESGLRHIEEELGICISADSVEQTQPIPEQLAALHRRVERLEQTLQAQTQQVSGERT